MIWETFQILLLNEIGQASLQRLEPFCASILWLHGGKEMGFLPWAPPQVMASSPGTPQNTLIFRHFGLEAVIRGQESQFIQAGDWELSFQACAPSLLLLASCFPTLAQAAPTPLRKTGIPKDNFLQCGFVFKSHQSVPHLLLQT